jgi:hypothetical protein
MYTWARILFFIRGLFEVEKESSPVAMPRRKKNAPGRPSRTKAISSLTQNDASQKAQYLIFPHKLIFDYGTFLSRV